MKEGNIKIFKKSIRQRRAISSNIWENGSYNGSEKERNKSNNSIKTFHRKTTTSYFYGSYLSSNLENDLLNNLNIDEINNRHNDDESFSSKEKDKQIGKNNLINPHTNQENYDSIFNVSFHSYELDNSNSHNNSVIVKTEENLNNTNKTNNDKNINNGQNIIIKNNRNDNKLLLNDKENKFNTERSFVSFKNNLKYIKDQEERVTKSYLLALGMTTKQNKKEEKEEKEQYLPTASIIEEEKSDLIDSKSEFSNKKKNIKNTLFFEDSLNNNFNKNKLIFVKRDNKLKIINISEKENLNTKNEANGCEKINFINVNRNQKNIITKRNENNLKEKEKLSLRISVALNEIINKNNKKEENKRKYLKKNKTILLNSFFNLTYKGKKSKINENNNTQKVENNKDIFKKTENNNIIQEKLINKMEMKLPFFQKKKMENSHTSNLIKIRYNTENSDAKKSLKKKILQNKEISSNSIHNSRYKNIKPNNLSNLNNSINSNVNLTHRKNNTFINDENKSIKSSNPIITKIEYRPKSRIPHIRQKIIDKKDITNNNNININNIKNYTINKYSAPNKKYITKIVNIPHKKTHSFTKEKIILNGKKDNLNLNSIKQIKTINEALTLIRIDRINSKKKKKSNSKKIYNLSFNKNKNSNSSSFTRATRSNSKSSRSKEKKIFVSKTNSGFINYRNELSFNLFEETNINTSNKNQTIITLKEKLIYSKSYIKNDVLEKIVKTFNSDNSFFILFCEKYIKVENDKALDNNYINTHKINFILLFKSLMKYYQNQNRFIKIYGEENAPNVISVKNIDINNYYIYRTKCIQKSNINKNDFSLTFELINELKFTTNAIVLCQK